MIWSRNQYRKFFTTCCSKLLSPDWESLFHWKIHTCAGLTFLPRYSSLESMRSEWPKNSFPVRGKKKEEKEVGHSGKNSGNTTYIILTLIGPYNFPDNSTIIILRNPSIRPRTFHPGTKMPPSKTPSLNNGLHMLPIYHPFALRNGFRR